MNNSMKKIFLVTLALMGAVCHVVAEEEGPPPVLTGIESIDWAAEQVNFTLREAEPALEHASVRLRPRPPALDSVKR